MSEQKERPILFNGEMVRAILEGRKTVTRRAIKPAPQMVTDRSIEPWAGDPAVLMSLLEKSGTSCPYGNPGDRLWVRESTESYVSPCESVTLARYCADKAPVLLSGCEDPAFDGSVAHWDYPRTVRPSIHMNRAQARILLEITAVRVERLQDITEDQARAEGITDGGCTSCGNSEPCGCDCPSPSAVDSFYHLWKSTGGDLDANPWVWVVEFKRVDHLA